MKTYVNYFLLIFIFISLSSNSFSQILGGRSNSESSPKLAEPTKLSGGIYSGDVNIMTGEYNSTIPLGSVATPGGLKFDLNLQRSSSFSISPNLPSVSGIPYGEGWDLAIPTISVQTDIFNAFGLECNFACPPANNILEQENEFNKWDGNLVWYSPTINIPGVGGGQAVFKYIDEYDQNCAVFVLNTFESPIESRFYGDKWVVILADGTRYEFSTMLQSYRAPSNKRKFNYSCNTETYYSHLESANILMEDSETFPNAPALQKVIEPMEDYGVWYCERISNDLIPMQSIRLSYEGFGAFNYFKEFQQARYAYVRSAVFQNTIPNAPDF
jgi:hypothetical protein